jgi:hypothetical protein
MENYKHTFCGSSSNYDRKFEDVFDIVFQDEEIIAVYKDTKRVYLGSKGIDLKLVLQIEDFSQYSDEKCILSTLYYVPMFKNLHKDRKQSMLDSIGDPDLTMKEYADNPMYYFDAVSDGLTIYLCQEKREYESDEEYKEVLEKLKADITNTCWGYMGLIGFYLNRPVNRIGENGWDYLRQFCNGVKMQTILKELKKRYE